MKLLQSMWPEVSFSRTHVCGGWRGGSLCTVSVSEGGVPRPSWLLTSRTGEVGIWLRDCTSVRRDKDDWGWFPALTSGRHNHTNTSSCPPMCRCAHRHMKRWGESSEELCKVYGSSNWAIKKKLSPVIMSFNASVHGFHIRNLMCGCLSK